MRGARLRKYGIGFPIVGQAEESFWALPGPERMLLIAAYLCDVVKVRETGWNRGTWVERALRSVGLGPGYAWCAAFVSLCAELAEYKTGPAIGRGRVANWAAWAKKNGRIVKFAPVRGDLAFWLNPDGTGHIGPLSQTPGTSKFIDTIEGNTNATGSREGDGVYRKVRPRYRPPDQPRLQYIRL